MSASAPRRGGSVSRYRWLFPALAVLAWLVLGAVAGPYAGKLAEVAENDAAAFLPAEAESTEVARLQEQFVEQKTTPLIVVWESDAPLPQSAAGEAAAQVEQLREIEGVVGPAGPPLPSEDGRALTAVVQVDDEYIPDLPIIVDEARATVSGVAGSAVYVTGPAGFVADLNAAFEGIDGLLLLVTLGVVLVILLLVYRSPILPLIVLLSSVFALGVASYAVYLLADSGTLDLNGQSQGIMSILVVGAATDYALLLVARFREELREQESRYDAMRIAWRQVLGPIVASGGTVIAGVLCLLFSDLTSNRSLGPVAALGIAGAMLAALTFLPAVLVLLGRAAYWPFRPALGSEHPEQSGVWAKVAGTVERRPRRWWVGVTLVLVAGAALAPLFKADGVSQSDLFLQEEESVAGQEALVRHFPGGAGTPAVVIAPADQWQQVRDVVAADPGIEQVVPDTGQAAPPTSPGAPDVEPQVVDGRVLLEATLADAADSTAAQDTIADLRRALDDVSPDALVGGQTAQQLDTNEISAHDRTIIIPIVLAVILLVLMLLLRSVLAPVLLILTVVLSFAATLGVAAVVFDQVFGWPGADPGVPLFAFVFLVALGIDYNIFLMTRVREESERLGTRAGVLKGLIVTGGVITSAGLVLAATFSALGVIPVLFLAQIAFLVAFGVLLDTFIVRSLLVPALAYDVGPRIWWPSRLQHDPTGDDADTREPQLTR